MTADGSAILDRTLNGGQFPLEGQRVPLGGWRKIGPVNWLAARAAGLVLGTPTVKGAEALSLNPLLFWTWLLHAAAITPFHRRLDPNIQLVILRTVWNAHGRYEWYVHFHVSRLGGISPETIERVCHGPADPGWTAEQRALLRAVDDVQAERKISTATWAELAPYVDDRRLAEFFFVVGLYDQLAMLFNSLGLEHEPKRFRWAPLMVTRRPDDSDALLPRRIARLERSFATRLVKALKHRSPYVLLRVEGREVPVRAIVDENLVTIPLPYGDNRRWVRAVMRLGEATLVVADQNIVLMSPRVLDSTQTQAMSKRAHRASRISKVLVAEQIL